MTVPVKGSQSPPIYVPSAPPVGADPAAMLQWLTREFTKVQQALKRTDERLKAGSL
jgi:hypothetical protein